MFQGVLCTTLALGLAAAQTRTESQKPDFTGKWKLNLEKSRLQIPAPTTSAFVIEHREPKFRLTRTHFYGDRSDTISFELTTDGKQYKLESGDLRARARLYWDGSVLVADMKVSVRSDKGTNVDRYSLENNGQTFIADERWRSTKHHHDNLWVFDRIN